MLHSVNTLATDLIRTAIQNDQWPMTNRKGSLNVSKDGMLFVLVLLLDD